MGAGMEFARSGAGSVALRRGRNADLAASAACPGVADGAVRGKAALRDYIKRALERVPDLTFTLDRVFSGVNSVVIEFHTSDGRHGAELMDFAKNGSVARVIAHYASE
jgi:predicted ester cyclase